MPKFFKRDILAPVEAKPENYNIQPEVPQTPVETSPEPTSVPHLDPPASQLSHEQSIYLPAIQNEEHHANMETWHDPVSNTMEHIFDPSHMKPVESHPIVPEEKTEDHLQQQDMNGINQDEEKKREEAEEEPLLPSPLDTPELPPAHTQIVQPQLEELPNESTSQPTEYNQQTPTYPTTAPQSEMSESKLVETLINWQAPSRPHRKKDRSFYTTVGILITLIAMIALLAGEKMLVAVLFALMFLVYVINFIEPQNIEYRISTQGVTIDNHFYHWQELDSFWFEKKDGFTILHILTQLHFPGVLMLVLAPTINEDQLKRIVARFLPFHEIAPKSLIDRWAESLQKYFPLENPHK